MSNLQSKRQQFSLKAQIQRKEAGVKKNDGSDRFRLENVLSNSLKMIQKAPKKWDDPVFGNRNPSQPSWLS